jgi:hypothetical protein
MEINAFNVFKIPLRNLSGVIESKHEKYRSSWSSIRGRNSEHQEYEIGLLTHYSYTNVRWDSECYLIFQNIP